MTSATSAPTTRPSRPRADRQRTGLLLWTLAALVMVGSAWYQRTSGPTYPLRGVAEVAGEPVAFALIRSETTTRAARVRLPDPGSEVHGHLAFRRYPTDDPFLRIPLARDDGLLVAELPRQPAAGKLEYHLELTTPQGRVRIPESGENDPILRYKDPVPAWALVPHVVLMFLAILVGVRAGLGAVAGRTDTRRLAWTALGLMTLGGMILGPVVQKYAFGAFWTGFPLGYDLTDNKTLVMWLAWLAACAVIGTGRVKGSAGPGRAWWGRGAVVVAAMVMLVVYLIPHSLRGSQLDYEALDRGIDPTEAIRTGR